MNVIRCIFCNFVPKYASFNIFTMVIPKINFIDLFAGIGGIRLGLELAAQEMGYETNCVFTSEIKPHAIAILKQNHPTEEIYGDITKVDEKKDIRSDFDIVCAGFPCQAFSAAGNRDGFADTRGTLFFDVERIVRARKPKGVILENVEGLMNHDNGNTLKVIVRNLKEAGYNVSYNLLNSKNFGVPQERKRVYIVGVRKDISKKPISLTDFDETRKTLGEILEKGKETSSSPFVKLLLKKYPINELLGKSIKDKRGGTDNIHSWDLEMKGKLSVSEKELLNRLMTERRKKKWADIIGIKWMDGMPLTKEQIEQFYNDTKLQKMLDHLTECGYLRFEHPKQQIEEKHKAPNGKMVTTYRRVSDTTKPKGYNIVAGKLSFEVSKVLSPNDIAPTLVATDMQHLYVADGEGLRTLTLREGLRLFGYPENYKFDIDKADGYDLLGNTVVVPVIKSIALRLLESIYKK